jgi:DNA topoisomerase IA
LSARATRCNFLQDFEYEATTADFGAGGETFRATGRTVINLGWQGWDKSDGDGKRDKGGRKENEEEARETDEILENGEDNDIQLLPAVREGETGAMRPSVAEKTTNPPKPYTYHGLIGAMNNYQNLCVNTLYSCI